MTDELDQLRVLHDPIEAVRAAEQYERSKAVIEAVEALTEQTRRHR